MINYPDTSTVAEKFADLNRKIVMENEKFESVKEKLDSINKNIDELKTEIRQNNEELDKCFIFLIQVILVIVVVSNAIFR